MTWKKAMAMVCALACLLGLSACTTLDTLEKENSPQQEQTEAASGEAREESTQQGDSVTDSEKIVIESGWSLTNNKITVTRATARRTTIVNKNWFPFLTMVGQATSIPVNITWVMCSSAIASTIVTLICSKIFIGITSQFNFDVAGICVFESKVRSRGWCINMCIYIVLTRGAASIHIKSNTWICFANEIFIASTFFVNPLLAHIARTGSPKTNIRETRCSTGAGINIERASSISSTDKTISSVVFKSHKNTFFCFKIL